MAASTGLAWIASRTCFQKKLAPQAGAHDKAERFQDAAYAVLQRCDLRYQGGHGQPAAPAPPGRRGSSRQPLDTNRTAKPHSRRAQGLSRLAASSRPLEGLGLIGPSTAAASCWHPAL
jgi:hypothetical protein